MTRCACKGAELSCIIGNIFTELRPPCDMCGGEAVTIHGITPTGHEATITLTAAGFDFEGCAEDTALLQRIRKARCIYPEYQDNHEYKTKGEIIRYDGLYYEIVAPHTSNAAAYPVQTTFAYYRLVELEHAGTLDDPIPYPETAGIVVNVVEGLYYSYKGAVYLAKADMPNCVYPPDTAGLWQWEKV